MGDKRIETGRGPGASDHPDPLKDDYQFLDCGNGLRLERFGRHIVSRSCPSAARQRPRLPPSLWQQAELRYEGTSGKPGQWSTHNRTDLSDWRLRVGEDRVMILNCYEMGQVGVFPEQINNWQWIRRLVKTRLALTPSNLTILNGFAYTGGSTLASLAHPSVTVTHLDSSKSITQLAKNNLNASRVQGSVRWIVDDCMTFLQREIKRTSETGVKYDGLIFDPPAFGRGSKESANKFWKLDKDLPLLFDVLPELLSKKPLFVLITCHDVNWPSQRLAECLQHSLRNLKAHGSFEYGDLVLSATPLAREAMAEKGNSLSLGSFARWSSK